uniref:Cytochrome b6/f complex subunit VIII n=1 Tax=Solanum lycopersicum TaxID=4081 RepID=A0A3Q7ICP6_SOLLC
MERFLYIYRDRGHNSYGYSKSCLGCFNGSLYFFPFTRSVGKKWTLGVLIIEIRKQTVSISIAF